MLSTNSQDKNIQIYYKGKAINDETNYKNENSSL